METFSVIQGDTVNVQVDIKNPKLMNIVNATFCCPSLQLTRDLTPTNKDDCWLLEIEPNVTKNLYVGRWDFDITVYTDKDEIFTAIHNGCMEVLYKRS